MLQSSKTDLGPGSWYSFLCCLLSVYEGHQVLGFSPCSSSLLIQTKIFIQSLICMFYEMFFIELSLTIAQWSIEWKVCEERVPLTGLSIMSLWFNRKISKSAEYIAPKPAFYSMPFNFRKPCAKYFKYLLKTTMYSICLCHIVRSMQYNMPRGLFKNVNH